MKRTSLFLIGFLLLGVAVFGSWQFLLYLNRRETSKHENVDRPLFIRLEPFYVQIFGNGRVVANRQFVIMLETRAGNPYRAALRQVMPIRSMIIEELARLVERSPPNNIDNLAFVRQQLLGSIERRYGEGIVWGISFETVFTQPPVQ
ncbi:MAG: hypothetical protein ORO03_07865 [Alphaproteobacteria bacterium]|nr:hypothetical protein [Alphaproteobacteria bacterium]